MARLCHQQSAPVIGVSCYVRNLLVMADSYDGKVVFSNLFQVLFEISHVCFGVDPDNSSVEKQLR